MAAEMSRLERLDQAPLVLSPGELDVRDRKVIDVNGEEIGTVHGLFVDTDERKVRFLDVRGGGVVGIGDLQYLIPVEIVEAVGNVVRLARDRGTVRGAPRYDPELEPDPGTVEDVYGWYGVDPVWGAWMGSGRFYSPPPGTAVDTHGTSRGSSDEDGRSTTSTAPRREER